MPEFGFFIRSPKYGDLLVQLSSAEDLQLALSYGTWGVCTARRRGRPSDTSYAARRAPDGKPLLLHRLLLEAPKGSVVDHINGDGLDNRRDNLRLCNQSKNMGNAQKSRANTSGYKGVTWDKSRSAWVAQIMMAGKNHMLGRFASPEEAHLAYTRAAEVMFGEFANPNGVHEGRRK